MLETNYPDSNLERNIKEGDHTILEPITYEKVTYKGSGKAEENRIYNLFYKYKEKLCYRIKIIPATENEIQEFIKNCKKYNVPEDGVKKLVEYYKMNNNFFNYTTCNDLLLFEWYNDVHKELWLGQRDDTTFRYIGSINKFAIGDASNPSYGKDYEFDSIEEMLESFLSGKTI